MGYSLSRLEKVRRGDVEAFADIFEEYHLRICRYLCSLVNDGDLAEDLAQQTFVKAYKALVKGSPPGNLNAWLYTIATNTALSALRRRRLIAWLPIHGSAQAARFSRSARQLFRYAWMAMPTSGQSRNSGSERISWKIRIVRSL